MGLDIVELGIMIEKEFGLRIEDSDYERLKTVGDVERYVNWKLGRTGTSGWDDYNIALVRGFCEIRREIIRQTGTPRSRLRPSTRLEEHWRIQEEWNSASHSLGEALTVPLPTWRGNGWRHVDEWMYEGCFALLVLTVLLSLGIFAFNGGQFLAVTLILALICWGAGLALLAGRSDDGFRTANLGSVARHACYPLSRLRGDDIAAQAIDRSQGADVMSRLVEMIGEAFSIPKEEIRPESRFYEDLRMG